MRYEEETLGLSVYKRMLVPAEIKFDLAMVYSPYTKEDFVYVMTNYDAFINLIYNPLIEIHLLYQDVLNKKPDDVCKECVETLSKIIHLGLDRRCIHEDNKLYCFLNKLERDEFKDYIVECEEGKEKCLMDIEKMIHKLGKAVNTILREFSSSCRIEKEKCYNGLKLHMMKKTGHDFRTRYGVPIWKIKDEYFISRDILEYLNVVFIKKLGLHISLHSLHYKIWYKLFDMELLCLDEHACKHIEEFIERILEESEKKTGRDLLVSIFDNMFCAYRWDDDLSICAFTYSLAFVTEYITETLTKLSLGKISTKYLNLNLRLMEIAQKERKCKGIMPKFHFVKCRTEEYEWRPTKQRLYKVKDPCKVRIVSSRGSRDFKIIAYETPHVGYDTLTFEHCDIMRYRKTYGLYYPYPYPIIVYSDDYKFGINDYASNVLNHCSFLAKENIDEITYIVFDEYDLAISVMEKLAEFS